MNRTRPQSRPAQLASLALCMAILLSTAWIGTGGAMEVTPLSSPAPAAESPRHASAGWGATTPYAPVYASSVGEYGTRPVVGHGNLVSKDIWDRYGRRPNAYGNGAPPAGRGVTIPRPGSHSTPPPASQRYMAPGRVVYPTPSASPKPSVPAASQRSGAAIPPPPVVQDALQSAPATTPRPTALVPSTPQSTKMPAATPATAATPSRAASVPAAATAAPAHTAASNKTTSAGTPPSPVRQEKAETISASWIIHRPASPAQGDAIAVPTSSVPAKTQPTSSVPASADAGSAVQPSAAAVQAPKHISASWLIPPATGPGQSGNATSLPEGTTEETKKPYHAPPSPAPDALTPVKTTPSERGTAVSTTP